MEGYAQDSRAVSPVSRRELLAAAVPVASLLWLDGTLEARATERPGTVHCPLRLFLGDAAGLDVVLDDVRSDPEVRRWVTDELEPLLIALPEGLAATPLPPPPPLPVSHLTAHDERFLRSFVESLLPGLIARGPSGSPPDQATIDQLIDKGILSVRHAMAAPEFDPTTSLINQAADFNAAVIGNIYVALDRSAQSLILLAPAGKVGEQGVPHDTLTDEQLIMVVSLLVELLGLLAGLAGLILPKVPLGPLAKAVLPSLKSPTVRNAITKLLATLASRTATLADKASAISDFLTALAAAGVITETIAEMVKGLSWVDYLRLAIQLGLFVASFLVTGGAALAAKVAVALAVSLAEIIEKVRKIVAG